MYMLCLSLSPYARPKDRLGKGSIAMGEKGKEEGLGCLEWLGTDRIGFRGPKKRCLAGSDQVILSILGWG